MPARPDWLVACSDCSSNSRSRLQLSVYVGLIACRLLDKFLNRYTESPCVHTTAVADPGGMQGMRPHPPELGQKFFERLYFGHCGETADQIRMPFGVIGRTGQGMHEADSGVLGSVHGKGYLWRRI